MPKVKNPVWRFFASVKLALISLFILAVTSIVGTLIKQGQAPSYYVREYGLSLARFFKILDLTNMYKSWWFFALLCFFAVNIVVCTIERLPSVWRMVVLDNLGIAPEKLAKMGFTHRAVASLPLETVANRLQQLLDHSAWRKSRRLDRKESVLLFVQKGAWTRLGVYVVHLSFLIILIGAVTGKLFGYQAYVFLPEGRTTNHIFLQGTRKPVPLGFKLRCDRFDRTLYDNGMVKEFRADLTVIDPKREALYHKSVIVNDPLSYRGLTFYQADSFPMKSFTVSILNRTAGREQTLRMPAGKDIASQETGSSLQIEELKGGQDGAVTEAKIRFATDGSSTEPSIFWIENNGTRDLRLSGKEFTITLHQCYTTLLLVTRDPGIMIVYLGCIMMILGLAICFFLSHRRVWLLITTGDTAEESSILVSGTTNKNKPSFERRFMELTNLLGQDSAIRSAKDSA